MQSVPREWLDFLRQQFPKDSRIQLTEILDYLAYQMGCGILSDLRLFQQSERLHRLTAAIPLGACSEQEWLDAAQYLTGHDCASALEARNRLVR